VPSARSENGEGVSEDASKRLQIPSQPAPKEKLCHLLTGDANFVFEKELDREPTEDLRLWHRRRKNAENDDKSEVDQVAIFDFCLRGVRCSGFSHLLALHP